MKKFLVGILGVILTLAMTTVPSRADDGTSKGYYPHMFMSVEDIMGDGFYVGVDWSFIKGRILKADSKSSGEKSLWLKDMVIAFSGIGVGIGQYKGNGELIFKLTSVKVLLFRNLWLSGGVVYGAESKFGFSVGISALM